MSSALSISNELAKATFNGFQSISDFSQSRFTHTHLSMRPYTLLLCLRMLPARQRLSRTKRREEKESG